MKGCFVCQEGGRLPYVFRNGRDSIIKSELEMPDEVITEKNYKEHAGFLQGVEVIVCTWDMVPFTKEEIRAYFPNLKLVLYGAGSVQYFGRPFLELGVKIISCWQVMAKPVAQFTLAAVVLANKGALMAMRRYRTQGYQCNGLVQEVYPGTYGAKVGILGAGAIGSIVISELKRQGMDVMVYDPFLSEERKNALGIAKTYPLEDIFAQCHTVSNHLANNQQTRGMLDHSLFSRMDSTAAFINTGRGAQVVEQDLVRALKEEPLRTAILDVTDPEPVAPDSELLSMENVFLFPHIAGYARDEVLMFPDFLIDQLRRYKQGLPFESGIVTLDMLKTMA